MKEILDRLDRIECKTDSMIIGLSKLDARYESDHERMLINEEITKSHSKKINLAEGAGKFIVVIIGTISALIAIFKLFIGKHVG
jgi:hypothetical protein